MPGFPTSTSVTVTDVMATIDAAIGNVAKKYVWLVNIATGVKYGPSAATDSSGNWSLASVDQGIYETFYAGESPVGVVPTQWTTAGVKGYMVSIASNPALGVGSVVVATPNGVDDTAAVIAALASLPAGGGTLWFQAGTYKYKQLNGAFLGCIDVNTANVRFIGTGAATIFQLLAASSSSSRIVRVFVDDFECSNIQFDITNGVGNPVAIFVTTANRTNIHHNLFTSATGGGGGVHPSNGVFDLLVTNNQFRGAGYGILTDDNTSGGRYVIANNSFTGGSYGDGIEINVPTTGMSDILIAGNRIANYTQVAANLGFGIGISGCSMVSVTGNEIRNCGRNGIHVDPDAKSTDTTISGNTVIGCGQAGIEVQSESGLVPANITIYGNVVAGCCTNPLYNLGRGGIECGSSTSGAAAGFGVKGLVITGNLVEGTLNSKAGIYVFGDGTSADPATVTANVCRSNTGNGILMYNGLDMIVMGNRCRDNTLFGLRLDGAATGLHVIGNTLTGNTGGAVTDVSSGGQVYRSNIGYNPQPYDPTPAVPLTTVAAAAIPFDADIYITAGASTCAVSIGGVAVMTIPASGVGTARLIAGKQIILTYTAAPTWKWYSN